MLGAGIARNVGDGEGRESGGVQEEGTAREGVEIRLGRAELGCLQSEELAVRCDRQAGQLQSASERRGSVCARLL